MDTRRRGAFVNKQQVRLLIIDNAPPFILGLSIGAALSIYDPLALWECSILLLLGVGSYWLMDKARKEVHS